MNFKDRLNTFLSRYSLSTHSIVVASIFLVNAYYDVPQVHDYAWDMFEHFPRGLKSLILTLSALFMWYWRGRRTWTPDERLEKSAITGSAPPGTSAGGDSPKTMDPKLAPPAVDVPQWIRH